MILFFWLSIRYMITTGLIRCVSALKHHPLYTSSTPAPHRLHTTHVRGRWWNGVDTDMIRCWYGDGGSSMQRINGLDARKSHNSLIFLCGSVSRSPPREKKFSTVRHFLTFFSTNIYKGANFFFDIFFTMPTSTLQKTYTLDYQSPRRSEKPPFCLPKRGKSTAVWKKIFIPM